MIEYILAYILISYLVSSITFILYFIGTIQRRKNSDLDEEIPITLLCISTAPISLPFLVGFGLGKVFTGK